MSEPKFQAIITIPIFAENEAEAYARIDPYVRDLRVEATILIERRVAPLKPTPQSTQVTLHEGRAPAKTRRQ